MRSYKEFFVKCLNALKEDISSYKNEEDLWLVKGETKNPPGLLAIHLCGNLKHTIGAMIGKNGFVRNRDAEFASKDVPKKKIIEDIDETIGMIESVLDKLTAENLLKPWSADTFGEGQTVDSVLLRIAWHLGYHTGQINYHRRLLEK